MTHNDYIFSIKDGKFHFIRHFDDMYRNCVDPHGQSRELDRLDYQFVSLLVNRCVEIIRTNGREPRILDVGCGHGRFTFHMRQNFPIADVSGCDISPAALAKARDYARGCAFFEMDLKAPPSSNEPYDLLVALHVLYYFTDQEIRDVLHNLYTLLVPGGFLLVGYHLPQKMNFGRYIRNLIDARSLFEAHGFTMRFEMDVTDVLDMTYANEPVGRSLYFLVQRAP